MAQIKPYSKKKFSLKIGFGIYPNDEILAIRLPIPILNYGVFLNEFLKIPGNSCDVNKITFPPILEEFRLFKSTRSIKWEESMVKLIALLNQYFRNQQLEFYWFGEVMPGVKPGGYREYLMVENDDEEMY